MGDRIAEAAREVRARLLKAARAEGRALDPKWTSDGNPSLTAIPDDLWEGIDATPGEVLVRSLAERRTIANEATGLLKAAATGLGANMAMHETNSQLSTVFYGIRGVREDVERGRDPAATLNRVEEAVSHISRNSSFLSGLANLHGGNRSTGSEVLEGLGREFYWLRDARYAKYRLEAADAFLSATVQTPPNTALAVFANLVRNAFNWMRDGGTVRLDAWIVETPPLDQNGDEDWEREPGTTTLFSVEDSGPGIPEAKRASVFTPFTSGRGSSGIRLHICRSMLARSSLGIRAEGGGELGGARFVIGKMNVVDPVPSPPEHERGVLALAAWSLAASLADGDLHAVRGGAATWADIQAERLRISVEGPRDEVDKALAAGADGLSGLMAGTVRATDIEWPADPATTPLAVR